MRALRPAAAGLLLAAALVSPAHAVAPTRVVSSTAALTVETYAYTSATTDPDRTVDVYRQKGTSGRPWVAVIHGGSWAVGSKANEARAAAKLEAAGFVVFNVAYRLTTSDAGRPGVDWATQRDDVLHAVDWARAHAADFGAVADRGAVYGFSAGGHLAAVAGLTGNGSARVRAIVSASGVLQPHRVQDVADSDPAVGIEGDFPTSANRTLARWEAVAMRCPRLPTWSACNGRWNAFMPQTLISPDDPPVMMFQGTADPAVPPQTPRAFAYWLDRQHVENHRITCANWSHTEACAFDGGPRQAAMVAFLKEKTA